MRYLTKLASDIQLLVSKEHAASFVWKCDGNGDTRDAEDESSSDEDSDSDDRFVKFEVTKTVDEEEGVQTFPGFVVSRLILYQSFYTQVKSTLTPFSSNIRLSTPPGAAIPLLNSSLARQVWPLWSLQYARRVSTERTSEATSPHSD